MVRLILLFASASLACPWYSHAEDVEAIESKLSNGYVRTRLADGTYKPETYAFGKGDKWGGARVDPSVDKLDFTQVAQTMATALADQNYLPTRDPKKTDLLIMVYWGTTMAPEHSIESAGHQQIVRADNVVDRATQALKDALTPSDKKMAKEYLASAVIDMNAALAIVGQENRLREDVDMKNATMLGYDSEWLATFDARTRTARGLAREDMLTELEEDRYFVVLMAFDFHLMAAQKKAKLLWEARFSIREHDHEFDKSLAAMVAKASGYFGRDSNGLKHETLPDGKVEVGKLKNLGTLAAPAK
jgi:hypothetical protein